MYFEIIYRVLYKKHPPPRGAHLCIPNRAMSQSASSASFIGS